MSFLRPCSWHTSVSLAGTIPNVTILWGSWHWAVSGPIGPNLPVFQLSRIASESRTTFARTERAPKGDYGSFSSPPRKVGGNGERERENPLSFLSFCRSRARWKRKEHARDNIKRGVQTKMQKRESLDPTFRVMPAILVPSDHRCGSM